MSIQANAQNIPLSEDVTNYINLYVKHEIDAIILSEDYRNFISRNVVDYICQVKEINIGRKSNSTCKYLSVAFLVASLIIGFLGTASYLGYLNIGVPGVGNMPPHVAFYTMVGGVSMSFVTILVLCIENCVRNKSNKPHHDARLDEEDSFKTETAHLRDRMTQGHDGDE
ncbi:MAG: hypothetical protein R3E91_00780 [Chlamydiales bacterium]